MAAVEATATAYGPVGPPGLNMSEGRVVSSMES